MTTENPFDGCHRHGKNERRRSSSLAGRRSVPASPSTQLTGSTNSCRGIGNYFERALGRRPDATRDQIDGIGKLRRSPNADAESNCRPLRASHQTNMRGGIFTHERGIEPPLPVCL